jgi:hypothetical protein
MLLLSRDSSANISIDTLEEKIASFNEGQGELRRRLDAIAAREEKHLMQRSNAALEYAVSLI